jgi:hypothetical protein
VAVLPKAKQIRIEAAKKIFEYRCNFVGCIFLENMIKCKKASHSFFYEMAHSVHTNFIARKYKEKLLIRLRIVKNVMVNELKINAKCSGDIA